MKPSTSTTQPIPSVDPPLQALVPANESKFAHIVRLAKGIKLTPKLIVAIIIALIIVISGAILFMILVGMVSTSNDKLWLEVTSQILNATFTLLALYNHPYRLLTLLRIIKISRRPYLKYLNVAERIKKEFSFLGLDLVPVRTTDESNRTASWKPAEKSGLNQLIWIFSLLNLNCFAQYPITIVMWGWTGSRIDSRPDLVIPIFLPISFLSGVIGSIWLSRRQATMKTRGSERVVGIRVEGDLKVEDYEDPDTLNKGKHLKNVSAGAGSSRQNTQTRPGPGLYRARCIDGGPQLQMGRAAGRESIAVVVRR